MYVQLKWLYNKHKHNLITITTIRNETFRKAVNVYFYSEERSLASSPGSPWVWLDCVGGSSASSHTHGEPGDEAKRSHKHTVVCYAEGRSHSIR